MEFLKFSFYPSSVPKIDSFVVAEVVEVDKGVGATVRLVEYGNKQALIFNKEISTRRIRTLKNHIREGKEYVLQVKSVDTTKCDTVSIDLSKKYVTPEDTSTTFDFYKRAKLVNSVAFKVSSLLNIDFNCFMQHFIYPLYKNYKHALDALQQSASIKRSKWRTTSIYKTIMQYKNDNIDNKDVVELINDKVLETFVDEVKKKLHPKPVKIQAKIELNCFEYEGIVAIKESLNNAMTSIKQNNNIKSNSFQILLESSPLYNITLQSDDTNKEYGMQVVQSTINQITNDINKFGGSCKVKVAPCFC